MTYNGYVNEVIDKNQFLSEELDRTRQELQVLSLSYDELKEKSKEFDAVEVENSSLKDRVMELEEAEDDLWEWIRELQSENSTIFDDSNNEEYIFNMAVEYRNDIANIFDLQDTLAEGKDNIFYDLEYLTDDQRAVVYEGIEKHLDHTIESEASYEAIEFIGNKPEPYNLWAIIGITPDEPMFYQSEEENEVIHLKVYYYKSQLWLSDNEGEPIYQFRGPFAGVSAIHVVIENFAGNWKMVYIGLG